MSNESAALQEEIKRLRAQYANLVTANHGLSKFLEQSNVRLNRLRDVVAGAPEPGPTKYNSAAYTAWYERAMAEVTRREE